LLFSETLEFNVNLEFNSIRFDSLRNKFLIILLDRTESKKTVNRTKRTQNRVRSVRSINSSNLKEIKNSFVRRNFESIRSGTHKIREFHCVHMIFSQN
jgi:uncharacterized protein YlbG (UPF0298 family)